MPRCKNDPTKSYKGDEPSPKGLGYCAHAEPVLTTRKGRDGKKYEVRLNTNGVKSWKLAPVGERPINKAWLIPSLLAGFVHKPVVKSGIPHSSKYQYELSFKLQVAEPVKMSNVDKFVQSPAFRRELADRIPGAKVVSWDFPHLPDKRPKAAKLRVTVASTKTLDVSDVAFNVAAMLDWDSQKGSHPSGQGLVMDGVRETFLVQAVGTGWTVAVFDGKKNILDFKYDGHAENSDYTYLYD